MPQGKVKWFNNAKGYGFIIEDGGSEDLFAHFSAVQMDGYKTLKAGQTVSFEKKPSDKGTHAVNIVPLDRLEKRDAPPKKAANAEHDEAGSETSDATQDNPLRTAHA
ncbi:cold shock domain-containing protein CspD [Marinobacter halodurans]|uniref:Cold shock-like protein CspD n=1 Tax=Marinobacter halodurans TaxID=2528979 RepID=A0ABY1ZS71_9GAMM|nr:cold shock domain-containing protein CspD [Marinobacter halodurans]TBW59134.1 cold shock domain-containing protein CspD [Marinobacter halodurans]